ncbi:MAG: hypothetical protein MJZ37_00370 [Bacilli bacterium]|nr:hypothetical protein [Bacilli bacterium]
MTKKEIATLFGWKCVTAVNEAFVKAESKCQSIKDKKGHYNKKTSIDYTLEETLIAMDCLRSKMTFTPMMKRYLIENFIHRDTPYALKEKPLHIPREVRHFIYWWGISEGRLQVCVSCGYFAVRTPNKQNAKPQPYCTFYERYFNHLTNKINIYKQKCPTYIKSNTTPYVFLETGPVLVDQVDRDNKKLLPAPVKTLGFDQSAFKSKRKKNEPIIILRDAFEDDF